MPLPENEEAKNVYTGIATISENDTLNLMHSVPNISNDQVWFEKCQKCRCCPRHGDDFPFSMFEKYNPKPVKLVDVEPVCKCQCRHLARECVRRTSSIITDEVAM